MIGICGMPMTRMKNVPICAWMRTFRRRGLPPSCCGKTSVTPLTPWVKPFFVASARASV